MRQILNNESIEKQIAIYQSLKNFMNEEDTTTLTDIKENRPWFPKEKFVHGNISKFIGNECSDLLRRALEKNTRNITRFK
ncbi:hypothetical protein [Thiothrix eikelboomii]|uniref:hypothetical protein n=1 Tax=Thiothrix eikelboomii TaxID=92487 RepID=UPI003BB05364